MVGYVQKWQVGPTIFGRCGLKQKFNPGCAFRVLTRPSAPKPGGARLVGVVHHVPSRRSRNWALARHAEGLAGSTQLVVVQGPFRLHRRALSAVQQHPAATVRQARTRGVRVLDGARRLVPKRNRRRRARVVRARPARRVEVRGAVKIAHRSARNRSAVHRVSPVRLFFSFFVCFYPNVLGHADNYIPANPLVTPSHIVPEWYFLPFYAILRSIPDKLGGVVAMVAAILILLLLPIINTSKVRSSKFRPIFSIAYWFLVSDFLLLGWLGQKPVESPYIEVGMAATAFYFIFLLVLVPIIGLIENKLVRN